MKFWICLCQKRQQFNVKNKLSADELKYILENESSNSEFSVESEYKYLDDSDVTSYSENDVKIKENLTDT